MDVFAEVCLHLGKLPAEVGEMSISQIKMIYAAANRMEAQTEIREANAARAGQLTKEGFEKYMRSLTEHTQ